jgi:ABC-type sugar transport system substrate-binding protein
VTRVGLRWAVAAAAVLVGCASGRSPSPSPLLGSTGPHAGKLTNIVYINPLPRDPFWDRLGDCMKSEAAKHGISVRIVGPAGGNVNVQAMQNMLSQAVAAKAQGIATWPGTATFDPLFAKARAQGAVVAALGVEGTKNQNFEIGTSPADDWRLRVRAVAKRPGHQYLGMILQYPTGTGAAALLAAVKDEVSKHPNLTLVDIKYNHGSFTDDVAIAGAMLTAHPEINVMMNYSGFPGMLTAIKEKHRVGKVVAFIGSNFREAILGYIDEGMIGGVVLSDRCLVGRLVVQKFLDLWAGKPVAARYGDGFKVVTGEQYRTVPRSSVP